MEMLVVLNKEGAKFAILYYRGDGMCEYLYLEAVQPLYVTLYRNEVILTPL